FFFQAEDGIRDFHVTGVQTCALPISQPAQMLLIPEIVELPQEDAERLMAEAADLGRFGLAIERFGPGAVLVRATPAMLGDVDARSEERRVGKEGRLPWAVEHHEKSGE